MKEKEWAEDKGIRKTIRPDTSKGYNLVCWQVRPFDKEEETNKLHGGEKMEREVERNEDVSFIRRMR